jgi:hypothetical protein
MGEKRPAPYGTQASAKSTPALSETRDKFLTRREEKGTQTPCAVESGQGSVQSPSPPFGRLGSPAGFRLSFEVAAGEFRQFRPAP